MIPFQGEGFYVGDTVQARQLLAEVVAKPPLVEDTATYADFDVRAPRRFRALEPARWDNIGWCSNDGRIVISGTDGKATLFAVARFLQRECGVRWWMPGELGEDIPKLDIVKLSTISRHIERPSYVSRDIRTDSGIEGVWWRRHNMLGERIDMHHSLNTLFDRSVAEAHPDWFPPFAGKAFDPQTWRGRIPHPVFTKDVVADHAAKIVIAAFYKHVDRLSYSLSPADTSLFGDVDVYEGLVDSKAAFRGKADLSNAVFTFYNNVAERVASQYRDRLLGVLAYSMFENVPNFPVERNLVPFLTADRSQWYDPAFKADDMSLIARWRKAGPEIIGTYDYYYGWPYMVPRVMLRAVGESIPVMHKLGVRAFYADTVPIWAYDAPKMWIASQLLWDSTSSPDELESEFFTGFFGSAALPMRRFFNLCDDVWMGQKGNAIWIRFYGDADQAVLFPDEIRTSLRAILDEALACELTDVQRKRVMRVSSMFQLTERFCKGWQAWQKIASWTPEYPAEELKNSIGAYLDWREDMASINANAGAGASLPSRLGYINDDDPLAGRLSLARSVFAAQEREALSALAPDYGYALMKRPVDLLRFPFRNGLEGWKTGHLPNPFIRYRAEAGNDGGRFIVERANSFYARRSFKSKPRTVYRVALRVGGTVSDSSTVRLLMEFVSEDGDMISFVADRAISGKLNNALLAVTGESPSDAATIRITILVNNQADGDRVILEAW